MSRGSRASLTSSSEVGGSSVRTIDPSPCGRYTLIASLGRGGMGGVYLGVESGAGGFRKLVVVKKIHEHLAEESRFVAMFMDEARLAARMNHPNLVQTFSVGRNEKKIPFMAMEYMEGVPFNKVVSGALRAGNRLPEAVAVPVIYHALAGLHHAHELKGFDGAPLNVVHRDISPSNLFLTQDGIPKVLDFGIAKASDSENTTKVGEIKGKYGYMSPEQAAGRSVDRRADLWSVGVALYAALTGKHLFRRKSDVQTIQNVMELSVGEALRGQVGISPRLREIIEHALERDIDARYPTAEAMRSDLANYAREAGISLDAGPLAAYIKEHFGEELEARKVTVEGVVDAFEEWTKSGDNTAWTDVEAPKFEEESVHTSGPPRTSIWALLLFAGLILVGVFGIMRFTQPAPGEVREIIREVPVQAASQNSEQQDKKIEPLDSNSEEAAKVDAAVNAQKDAGGSSVPAHTRGKKRTLRVRGKSPKKTVQAKEPVVAEKPPAPPGYLTIMTRPWAEVFVDGKSLGTTPLSRVKIPSGPHTLVLKNVDQGITKRLPVEIKAGGTTVRNIALQ